MWVDYRGPLSTVNNGGETTPIFLCSVVSSTTLHAVGDEDTAST